MQLSAGKYGIICRVTKVATDPFLEVTDPGEAIGLWSRPARYEVKIAVRQEPVRPDCRRRSGFRNGVFHMKEYGNGCFLKRAGRVAAVACGIVLLLVVAGCATAPELSLWRDEAPAKKALLEYVEAVTDT